MLTDKTNGWGKVSKIGLDFAAGDGVGLGDADAVSGIELKPVVALDTISFIDSVRGVYKVNNTDRTVSNLPLTIDEITPGDSTSLLPISDSQIKPTYTLVANVTLQTHVTVLDVTGVGQTLGSTI